MQTVPEAVQTAYHGPLMRVSGSSPQPVDDPLWFQLTRVGGVSLSSVEPALVYRFIEPFAVQLAQNNTRTGHYALLISHSVESIGAASSFTSQVTVQEVQAASNCIILLRNLTVGLLHNVPPSSLRRLLLASSGEEASQDVLLQLVSTCFTYIDQVELTVHTYSLYHASLEMLIACCCSSLYHMPEHELGVDLMLQILHNHQQHGHAVVTRLLNNILLKLPVSTSVLYQPPKPQDGTASVLGTVNTLMMFPVRAVSSMWRQDSWGETVSPAANASLSLLLLLLHQTKLSSSSERSQFLIAFQDLVNTDGFSQDGAVISGADSDGKVASASFSALFEWLVESSQDQQTALLLYSLLTRSTAFRQALVVRSDIDRLILPLLEQAYKESTEHMNHLYIIQIVLLILSQDDGLARTVYKVRLQKVPWYSDRNGLDLSVGDLMLVVLMKSAFRNATTIKDEYVHTNSMSIMINLAPQAAKLSPVTTQRLCSSIEASHKRLLWLDQKLVETVDKSAILHERQLVEDLLQNLIVLLDILVYRTLAKNPELVYSMLHQQSILQRLASEPAWSKNLRNADAVVQHFNSCVDAARHALTGSAAQGEEWSVAQVMGVIQRELLSWKMSDLYAVNDMHCTYEEAPQACEFFLPYVWSTILHCPTSQYYPCPADHFLSVCNNHRR